MVPLWRKSSLFLTQVSFCLYFLRFEFELYLSFTHVGSLKSLSWSNPSHMAHNKVMWPDLLSLVNTNHFTVKGEICSQVKQRGRRDRNTWGEAQHEHVHQSVRRLLRLAFEMLSPVWPSEADGYSANICICVIMKGPCSNKANREHNGSSLG